MGTAFDAAVAVDEYSVAGRSVEIGGVPYEGLPDITGGGVTIEGQTYQRAANGSILSVSRGVKTPQDLTSVTTLGTFELLREQLQVAATVAGLTGDEVWMDVPITIVNQIASGSNPLKSHTETMIVSVMSWQTETGADGPQSKCTIVWKQHALPKL